MRRDMMECEGENGYGKCSSYECVDRMMPDSVIAPCLK